jgi:hypothetical protein
MRLYHKLDPGVYQKLPDLSFRTFCEKVSCAMKYCSYEFRFYSDDSTAERRLHRGRGLIPTISQVNEGLGRETIIVRA